MVPIRSNLVSQNMQATKCPFSMTPTQLVVHNTANDAAAWNEVSYMIGNPSETSFHYAVDDKEIVQGIPTNRNTWNAGDGAGKGNRSGISIEICYSLSGGSRFIAAEKNAAEFIAKLLKDRNWGISKVTKHQDYNGKYCPHRTLDMGWNRFLNMVKNEMDKLEKGEEVVTQTEFNKMMETYLAQNNGKLVKSMQDQAAAQQAAQVSTQSKKPVSQWAKDSWDRAVKRGVFDGTMPQNPLTREQAAKVFENLGLVSNGEVSNWAKDSWGRAVVSGLFEDTAPKEPLTREQLATILDRLGLISVSKIDRIS